MKYKLWEHYLLHRLTQREIILYSHKTSYSANTVIGMTGSAIKQNIQAGDLPPASGACVWLTWYDCIIALSIYLFIDYSGG